MDGKDTGARAILALIGRKDPPLSAKLGALLVAQALRQIIRLGLAYTKD